MAFLIGTPRRSWNSSLQVNHPSAGARSCTLMSNFRRRILFSLEPPPRLPAPRPAHTVCIKCCAVRTMGK